MDNPEHIVAVQNPHATQGVKLRIALSDNTPLERINQNVAINSRRPLAWLAPREQQAGHAIIVAGGPSATDHLDDIRNLQAGGGFVIAVNGAAGWLRKHGITADVQFIMDAKPETAALVDSQAKSHVFASQCDPATFDRVNAPMVAHMATPDVESHIEPRRLDQDGATLIGGGLAAGTTAICLAHVLGFKHMHLIGLDCSSRGSATHAYDQPMNEGIPSCVVEVGGKSFVSALTMKLACDRFMHMLPEFESLGLHFNVYGDGLLQTRYRAAKDTAELQAEEAAKYAQMWQLDSYRNYSPGETLRDVILHELGMPIGASVIDFGCGTGRLTKQLSDLGFNAQAVDFASNCLDPQIAAEMPLVVACLWDLPKFLKAPFGICCDVMEHIPTEKVDDTLRNIARSADNVFFNIATMPDSCGATVGETLHLTVRDAGWWHDKLRQTWGNVAYVGISKTDVQFICSKQGA